MTAMFASNAYGERAFAESTSSTSEGQASSPLPVSGGVPSYGGMFGFGAFGESAFGELPISAAPATATVVGAAAMASVGIVVASSGAPKATYVTVRVLDVNKKPSPIFTGLKWSFFDQIDTSSLGAPVAQGSNASIDGNGNFSVEIAGTSLPPGGVGILVFTNSDGTISQNPSPMAFFGPVVVS